MKLFRSSLIQASMKLPGAVACIVHISTIATASEKPPVPDSFNICSETDQSTLEGDALERIELVIDLHFPS